MPKEWKAEHIKSSMIPYEKDTNEALRRQKCLQREQRRWMHLAWRQKFVERKSLPPNK